MQSKSFLIAIAAFAVTTTGVQAYGTSILDKAGLSEAQKSALVQAHELKVSGQIDQARDVLVDAGIDENTLLAIHQAKVQARTEIHTALELGDYELFQTAVAHSPLAKIIESESDFEQFRSAHQHKQNGEVVAAQAILTELGIDHTHKNHSQPSFALSQLSEEQKDALQVARQANDRETVRAIFAEAGIDTHRRR